MEELNPEDWHLKGNRPRRIYKHRAYPEAVEGRRCYVIVISKGDKHTTQYVVSPVEVAHKIRSAHKKKQLVFVYVAYRSVVGGGVAHIQQERAICKRMGTLNWIPQARKWRRWNRVRSKPIAR